jgi:PAS domain S-box-containing protein
MGTRSFTIGIAFSQSKDRQLLKQYINDLGYQLVDILTDDQHHGLTDDIDLYFIEYALAKKYETQLLRLREKSTVKLELVPILVGLPNKANPNPWLKAGFNDIIRLPLSKEVLATRFEVWLRIQEESQLRFRSLYENATLGLYRTTPEGKILLANPTLVKMLGYNTLEDLQERNLEMEGFEPGYERAAFRRRLEQEEIIRGLESVWKRKDGSSIYIRESARVIKDAKGKPLYYEGTVEDITERKQVEISLKESERKYRQLVNSIRDAILVADTERNIIDCNPAFTNLFGYTLEDIQGKKTMVVYANEEQFYELGQAIREYYKGGEPFLYTVNYKKKNGDVFPGETGVYYLKDSRGNIIGFIGLIRDITERLAAEQELKRSLKEKEVL